MKPRHEGHEARPAAGWLEAGGVEGGIRVEVDMQAERGLMKH